jgi:nucleotide-binding universal stress UspA family protein
MILKHILVPTDFSPHAEAALRYAIDLAKPFGATITLLHVVEDPLAAGMWSSEIYTAEIAGLQINLVKGAEERLRRIAAKTVGVRILTEVRTGRTPSTILDVAKSASADLIVMGTAGRTGLAHVVMGSVAQRVVRAAACPVLTLRAEAEQISPATSETETPVAV